MIFIKINIFILLKIVQNAYTINTLALEKALP